MCWIYECAFEKCIQYYPRYHAHNLTPPGIKQTLACVRFSKLVTFKFIPPLNILTVPDWLNVKFRCFLIGPKAKI